MATFSRQTAVGAVSFDPTGEKLVGGCLSEMLHVYDVATRQRDRTLTVPRPYEAMSLCGTTGLSTTQWEILQQLGAIVLG